MSVQTAHRLEELFSSYLPLYSSFLSFYTSNSFLHVRCRFFPSSSKGGKGSGVGGGGAGGREGEGEGEGRRGLFFFIVSDVCFCCSFEVAETGFVESNMILHRRF
mmetsp:Transcript_22850/g.35558  ORF Transcript_22850/g.35558 Transcript_22850/m.35558 type:complete len:105 (+) Transcript_22850:243-557(+)